ncbi:MAG: hypothetical protein RLY86_3667 [Pseudomonadota bacterium]
MGLPDVIRRCRVQLSRIVRFVPVGATTPALRRPLLALIVALPVVTGCAPDAEAVADIAPHAATYSLKLQHAKSRSPVADVNGTMSFAWKDACDGWTIEQHFDVTFLYAEGEEVAFDTQYVTWESKDGSAYRFNVRKLINGEVDEELRGEATLAGVDGGTARFNRPEERDMALRPGTLFPTAHTIHLLEAAAEGEPFLSSSVFDGSESEGETPVSAVIGREKPAEAAGKGGADLRQTRAWPVQLAFFPSDPQAALPDYVSSMLMQRNGVVQSMVIDYGDFQVEAVLETLDTVPVPKC